MLQFSIPHRRIPVISAHAQIRRRREDLGASPEQAAAWAGISAERWREIERGGPVRTFEFGRAAEALGVDLATLARGEASSPRRSVARFRSATHRGLAAHDLRLLSLAAEMGRIGGQLLRWLDRDLRLEAMKRPVPVDDSRAPWQQGYALADAARRSCRPPTGPIQDLQLLLARLGVHVVAVPFAEKELDAASLWEPGAMPLILVNASSGSMERSLPRRAALAHELCHLLHDSGESDLTTQLSFDGVSRHDGAVEQRARAFGPAFLARKDDVTTWFRQGKGRHVRDPEAKVRKLAERWGLSTYGAIWHAKNCGLIRAKTAERLAESQPSQLDQPWAETFEASARSTQKTVSLGEESVDVSPLARGLVCDLTLAAADAGSISEGRAREILSWGRAL